MILVSVLFSFYTPGTLFAELFFIQDYLRGIWGHTWSLGVEEKFYILLPLLFILLSKINKSKDSAFNSIPAIFIFVSITCLLLRILNPFPRAYDYSANIYSFHVRFDSLFWGVVISYFYHYHSTEFKAISQRFKFIFLLFGFILLLPAFMFSMESTLFISTVGLTLFYLGNGLILIAVVDDKYGPNLLIKVLAYIGSHSYSIYLWFVPIKFGLDYLFIKVLPSTYLTWSNYTITYFTACICLGIMMSKLIEFPVLKLRDRIYPKGYL